MRNYNIRQAVILGAGERKCFNKPVGFLEVEDTPIIERLITLLNSNGIENIVVITGYKSEYYEELAKKKNLSLVYNERYKWTGTMSSLALAGEYINDDFILIESDMVMEERALTEIIQNSNRNCMLVTSESGSGDEVLVEMRDNHIFRLSKDIHQLNKVDGEFIGLSKISYEAYKRLLEDYKYNKNPYLNYEYLLLNIINDFDIECLKIDDLVWSELDTLEHYNNLKYVIYPKLQRKEEEVRANFVKSVVSEILSVDKDNITRVERLGGLTNKNYKIKVNGEDFVARIPGNGTSKFIDRSNEKINSFIAYELGLDSECLYFDESTGTKIARFVKNAETLNPATGKRENNMELMANAIKTLHSSNKKFKDTFDAFYITEFYEKALVEANGKVFDGYYDLKKVFMPLKDELEQLAFEYTPCHLDALPENFIKSGEDKIYLIDWEYSGNYDPLWDVAAVSIECSYTEDEEELFFKKYFGRKADEKEKRRIEIHKIMQDMFWCMWAAAKAAKGDDYLYDYSFDRYNRGKDNIAKYILGNEVK